MDFELTADQARAVWGLRRRFPGAELRTHQRPWGVILEVRRGGRTLALTCLENDGGERQDESLRVAD